MILFSMKPVPIMMQNLMMLDDAVSGGSVYVSRATYDQALLLWGRFDGDVNALMSFTKNDPDAWKDVPWIKAAMKWVKENAPEPLNILAPALKMCVNLKDIKEEDVQPELIYGLLHTISQAVDFNVMYLVPSEMRTQVKIPVGIFMNYKTSWENLLEPLKVNLLDTFAEELREIVSSIPESDDTSYKKSAKKKKAVIVEEEEEEEEEEDSGEDEEEGDEDDYFASIFAEAAAEVDAKMNSDEDKDKDKSNDAPATSVTSAPEPVKEDATQTTQATQPSSEQAAEANAVLDEFDY